MARLAPGYCLLSESRYDPGMRLHLAGYALFCSGCALIQLAHLAASRRPGDVRLSHLSVGAPGVGATSGSLPFDLAALHRRRARSRRLMLVAAILSLAVELVLGFVLFRWWVTLVVAASVTVVVDVAALLWPPRLTLLLGALACLAGVVAMLW